MKIAMHCIARDAVFQPFRLDIDPPCRGTSRNKQFNLAQTQTAVPSNTDSCAIMSSKRCAKGGLIPNPPIINLKIIEVMGLRRETGVATLTDVNLFR
jgi:hypothetical protein